MTLNPSNTEINSCTFRDNTNTRAYDDIGILNPGDLSFAGGYSLILDRVKANNATLAVMMRNCTFLHNHATLNSSVEDTRPRIYIPRGHGGAMLMSWNASENQEVIIEDSLFLDNTADQYGGGIYITMFQGSKGNRVIVRNSVFKNNTCSLDGGAISMHVFEIANDNLLWVEDTIFERNTAWFGGGACTINLQVSTVLY